MQAEFGAAAKMPDYYGDKRLPGGGQEQFAADKQMLRLLLGRPVITRVPQETNAFDEKKL